MDGERAACSRRPAPAPTSSFEVISRDSPAVFIKILVLRWCAGPSLFVSVPQLVEPAETTDSMQLEPELAGRIGDVSSALPVPAALELYLPFAISIVGAIVIVAIDMFVARWLDGVALKAFRAQARARHTHRTPTARAPHAHDTLATRTAHARPTAVGRRSASSTRRSAVYNMCVSANVSFTLSATFKVAVTHQTATRLQLCIW